MNARFSIPRLASLSFLALSLFLFAAGGSALAAKGDGGFTGPGGTAGHVAATQGGFTGPGPALMTVEQAKTQPDDTWVTLKGQIVQGLGDKRYQFRDSSGEIQVKVGRKTWRGLQVGPQDTVELQGKVDKEWRETHVDVKQVRKTQ